MNALKLISIGLLIILLTGCGPKLVKKGDAFSDMYAEKPLSILVLPPINESTAADAKDYYSTTVIDPLAFSGYYVFPIEVVTEILKKEGLGDTEMLMKVSPQKLREFFGADAILYIKILKWDTSYYVIGGNVTVTAECIMKSTITGKTIWRYDGTLTVDTTGENRAGGLLGLALQLAETAIKTATTDYVPIARRVNYMTLQSMPYGKYHTYHGKDMDHQVLEEKTKEKDGGS